MTPDRTYERHGPARAPEASGSAGRTHEPAPAPEASATGSLTSQTADARPSRPRRRAYLDPLDEVEQTHARALGERLRALRHAAAMTQADVAERAELAAATVSKWERGRGRIGLASVRRLAEVLAGELDVDALADELLALAGPIVHHPPSPEAVAAREARKAKRERAQAREARQALGEVAKMAGKLRDPRLAAAVERASGAIPDLQEQSATEGGRGDG